MRLARITTRSHADGTHGGGKAVTCQITRVDSLQQQHQHTPQSLVRLSRPRVRRLVSGTTGAFQVHVGLWPRDVHRFSAAVQQLVRFRSRWIARFSCSAAWIVCRQGVSAVFTRSPPPPGTPRGRWSCFTPPRRRRRPIPRCTSTMPCARKGAGATMLSCGWTATARAKISALRCSMRCSQSWHDRVPPRDKLCTEQKCVCPSGKRRGGDIGTYRRIEPIHCEALSFP